MKFERKIEKKHLYGTFCIAFMFGFAFGALIAIANFFNAVDYLLNKLNVTL